MITKQERDEYLSDSGLQEDELRLVFSELGVDFDAPEFEETIIEQVEATAKELGFAVNEVKRLAEAKPESLSDSSEMVAQQISEIMFRSLEEQGVSLSPEAILSLAQSKAEQYIELNDRIHELAERVYVAREAHNQAKFARKLISQSVQSRDVIEEVLGDDVQIQILESLTPQTRLNGEFQRLLGDLDARRKARNQIGAAKEQAIAALPPQNPKEFVQKFLAARKGS